MEKQIEIEQEFPLSDLDKAIYYVETSRQTHMDTIRNYREDPESLHEKVIFEDAVGNEVFHLICINEYNHVLKVLHDYEGLLKDGADNPTNENEVKPRPKRAVAAKNQEKI